MESIIALAAVLLGTVVLCIVFIKITRTKPLTARQAKKMADSTTRAQANCKDLLKLVSVEAGKGRWNVSVPLTSLYAKEAEVEEELHKLGFGTENTGTHLYVIW